MNGVKPATRIIQDYWKYCQIRSKYLPAVHLLIPIICGCIYCYLGAFHGVSIYILTALWLIPWDKKQGLSMGIFLSWVFYLGMENGTSLNPESKLLFGTVKTFSSDKKFVVRVRGNNLMVRCKSCPELFPTQKVRLHGKIMQISKPSNPGEFDYGRYLESRDINILFYLDSLELLKEGNWLFTGIQKTRKVLQSIMKSHLKGNVFSLTTAAVLGNRDYLSPELKNKFSNSGMYHLLAISGLHIGVATVLLLQFFSFIRIPEKSKYVVVAVVLFLYMFITGCPISVVRAVLMYSGFLIAVLMERPIRSINNLALACLVCLLLMPAQIISIGFQLSFGATFFLLAYARIFEKIASHFSKSIWVNYCISTISISGVLFLVTLPILSNSIHVTAPSAIFLNIGAILSTSVLVLSTFLIFLFSILNLGSPFAEVTRLAGEILISLISWTENLPGNGVFVSSIHPLLIFQIYLGLCLCPYFLWIKKMRLFIWMSLILISANYSIICLKDYLLSEANIVFLDVGQGDATMLHLPGDYHILIDAGQGGPYKNMGQKVLLPYLKSMGINKIDEVIITHSDFDHYGGLAYILDHVQIKRVLYPGIPGGTKSWKKLETKLTRQNIPLEKITCGKVLYKFGEIKINTLYPCELGATPGKNNNSVVVRVDYYHKSFLLTGDIENETETRLLQKKINVDVLKVPHHGSLTSSSINFIEKVDPEIAILSVGRKNSYGLPNKEILSRYKNREIITLNTSQKGAISYSDSHFFNNWNTIRK